MCSGLNPTIKDMHWFTSDYFFTASPSERARRPARGAQPLTSADVARNLKCKPFVEVGYPSILVRVYYASCVRINAHINMNIYV